MKIIRSALGLILSTAITAGAAVPLTVYADEDKLEKKEITAYLFSMEKTKTIECVFSSSLPDVPYITAGDYLGCIIEESFSETKNDDGTFSVSGAGIKMKIDTESDTVFMELGKDFAEAFKTVTEGSELNAPYLKIVDNTDYSKQKSSKPFDYSRYGIDIIEIDNKAYFPLNTISDTFLITGTLGIYKNESIYIFHSSDILFGNTYFDFLSQDYNKTERDPKIAEYTYNELCLVLDSYYGYPSKSEIADTMKVNGFDKTLDNYSDDSRRAKELLRSDNVADLLIGLNYLSVLFEDGGHTHFSYAYDTFPQSDSDSALGNELSSKLSDPSDHDTEMTIKAWDNFVSKTQNYNILKQCRSGEYGRYVYVNSWSDNSITFLRNDSTGIFVFDIFDNDVVEPFKWSLDFAKENGMKNIIVDVSCNQGGSSAVLLYMVGLMTNNKYHTDRAPELRTTFGSSESSDESYILADYNLDGVFDDLDKDVAYDLEFTILTSQLSFSCANLLPVMAHDEGIAVAGERSGGGTCAIAVLFTPENMLYTMSNFYKFISEEGEDVDSGVEPDIELAEEAGGDLSKDYNLYKELYNIDYITELTEEFYSSENKEQSSMIESSDNASSEQESAQPQSTESNDSSSSDNTPIWIITAIFAVTVLSLVCVIIIVTKRKKRD